MPSEIDELMNRICEDPALASGKDIDDLIAYHRKNRANAEAGIKPKKESGPKQKIDLAELGLVKAKPIEAFKRRV